MRAILKKLQDESGQAIIEYVLVLVVVVGVILGGLYQLNTAFRSWAENYFGDYLACLLETGELPALGGAGPSGECSQQHESFSLANGRPLVGQGVGAQSGAGSGFDSDAEDSEVGSYDYSGGGGGGAVVVQRLSSSGFDSGRSRRIRAPSRKASTDQDGKSSTGTAAITDLGGNDSSGRAIRIPLRSGPGLMGGRRYESEDDSLKDKTIVVGKTQGEREKKGPQLMRVERKPTETKAPDVEEFTFGKFLRYLLMAAIIIAIVIFIGGQILQASKSMD